MNIYIKMPERLIFSPN